MKFTLSWLKEHLETSADLATISERLTAIGLEVEAVSDPAERLGAFRVAKVISAVVHPNADRLSLCQVDSGDGAPVQVVCGAPNVKAGMKAVFAPSGTHIPGTGIDLKPTRIRGEESNGMLCSERELELSDEHDGIIALPDDAPLGARFIDYAGHNDPLIEIGLTPNRGDAAAVRGIARDLAAAGLGQLKANRSGWAGERQGSAGIKVKLETEDAPFFAYCLLSGVHNPPSPPWLQRHLQSVGQKPISALVDLTNFLTLDQCRPAHVFDADKLDGDLVVRKARPGETLDALNGKTYDLDPQMTVIADASGVVSLAGIIGGLRSSCTAETRRVLVELALWNPSDIARTGRRLQLLSDARYRFERGVDPANVSAQMEIITALLVDLCGGQPSLVQTEGQVPSWQRHLDFDWDLTRKRNGVAVSPARSQAILEALGFTIEPQSDQQARVHIPSWRPDIDLVEDLTEEILRIVGFEQIEAETLPALSAMPPVALSAQQARLGRAKRALASRGLLETVLWSFTGSRLAHHFADLDPQLFLENPIKSDLDVMRPSLLPNLLKAAQRNQARGFGEVALFESGLRFLGTEPDAQRMTLAGLRLGQYQRRHWSAAARGVDLFDAKADLLHALEAYGAPTANLQTRPIDPQAHPYLHPGRAATLGLGKQAVAVFGELHPALLAELDLRGPAVLFEIWLEQIPLPKKQAGSARSLLDASPLQPLTKDFAFVVDESVAAEALLRAVKAADKRLISAVSLFDIYRGAGVPEGQKSLAVEVTLQPRTASLTDADLDALSRSVIKAAQKATGAVLRS